jgi:2-keto-4-pentenoate hydratase/2-oxohepta-3-ene-1,7-dioic acid hydratase in catechol pathway
MTALLAAGPAALDRLRAATGDDAGPEPAFGPPVPCPGKVVCLGRNYREHADEMGWEQPPWPEVFMRLPDTVLGPFDDALRPSVSERLDYEGELGAIIGAGGRHIPADRALEAVAGYCVLDDVTVRDWQHRGKQWTPGKNFPATMPFGPDLVTADEIDPDDLAIETRVNGEVRQSSRTSQMMFGVAEQIEFISSWTELRPGDVIATGTPGGVGVARKPPVFLRPGDEVEITVETVGTIRHGIADDGLEGATTRWREVAEDAVHVQRK